MDIRITCIGGVGQVTGSCYLLELDEKKYLVDCGLFQGGKKAEALNWKPWPFNPSEIKALFLTHAHIDHSGRIPKLVKDGFRGTVYATEPTCELCRILFLDAAHIQEMHAEWQSRRNLRKGKPSVEPLYTADDAEAAYKLLQPVERDRELKISDKISITFRNAGHILGSSFIEIKATDNGRETEVIFTGDLGRPGQLIIKDPVYATKANALFIESTYGNRDHKDFEESKEELLEAIRYSYSKGEKVLIPAFAVERTQEVLYLLGEFFRNGQIPDMPVYLDSPLAIEATKIFRKMRRYYDEDAMAIIKEGHDPLDFPQLKLSRTVDESRAINLREGPAVVIAGNGMCTAGRILHHIKHNIWRDGCSIVFVGYQAEGSIGRKLIEGAKWIRVLGDQFTVRAKVFTIGGLSSHAGLKDLMEWLSHFENAGLRVFVVHGEKSVSEQFAATIRQLFGFEVTVPEIGDSFTIGPEPFEKIPERTCENFLYEISRRFLDFQHLFHRVISNANDEQRASIMKKLRKLDGDLEEAFRVLQTM